MEFNRCSVYYAELPTVDDDENVQTGVRPVLIVSNNINNKYNSNVVIVPLTSQQKRNKLPTHVKIETHFLKHISTATCETIMTISKRRLKQKLGEVSMKTMLEVQEAMSIQLGDIAL